MKEINIKELLAEYEGYSPAPIAALSNVTSKNAGHRHEYEIDEHGDGVAYLVVHPNNPKIKHKHVIKNYVVLEAQSSCYPKCESKYGDPGAGPHGHSIEKEVKYENFKGTATTSKLYKGRREHKQQVNNKNLPVGEQTSDGKILKNQLDLWYKKPFYGKYDSQLNLTKLQLKESNLKNVGETKFQMLDFAADAVNEFLRQYNIEREEHPQSKLNNIRVVKAYDAPINYDSYFAITYVSFFNAVLDQIKKTNKIKNIHDFSNLLYIWSSSKDIPITETGYYESRILNIYNTGLAFDFMEINSEEDKKTILNDVRFPVLNYVAKINGLRIDPNHPSRLILDIFSRPALDQYASGYFLGAKVEELPEKIVDEYFESVDFSKSSEDKIASFFVNVLSAYGRFISKYPGYISYQFDESTPQAYKRTFQATKVKRTEQTPEMFFNYVDAVPDGTAVYQTLSKESIRQYVKFRISEANTKVTKKQVSSIVDNMYVLNTISNKLHYETSKSYMELRHISSQAVNYLESFIKPAPLRGKSGIKSKKRDFIYFLGRGIQKTF
tara:strand:- start:2798 stop:4453 length:1656 start_codon:yes stop_codon:yes gene_type:complete